HDDDDQPKEQRFARLDGGRNRSRDGEGRYDGPENSREDGPAAHPSLSWVGLGWLERAARAMRPTPVTTWRMLDAEIASSVIPAAVRTSWARLRSGSGKMLVG